MERLWLDRLNSELLELLQQQRRFILVSSIHLPSDNACRVDIDSIVRQVLRKLRSMEVTVNKPNVADPSKFSLEKNVITLKDLTGVPVSATSLQIPASSIVTPSVRDELNQRGISVVRCGTVAKPKQAALEHSRPSQRPIRLRQDDTIDAGLFASVQNQATIRGVHFCVKAGTSVILSSNPASAVHRCITDGLTAAGVNRIDDVDRFRNDFNPTVYVLDVHHLSLMSLIHAIVRIGATK